jgi:hypothetical protein
MRTNVNNARATPDDVPDQGQRLRLRRASNQDLKLHVLKWIKVHP